jgi:selenide,water dikinase|tara:strand:+ start:807 stop:1751 length:945 start_codon:yes stop_codon:yes gene_type:complete
LISDERVIVGFNGHDDAAVVRLDDGKLLVQTVDFFTPIVDDPYQFGQIAAANSLSDIYAMGAKPIFALNIVGFPINDLPNEILTTILQGGADKAKEAGIPTVGGHSVDDKEPKYGLVVTGEVEEKNIVTNKSAIPGDVLVLTKPLGTGIIATAIKKGVVKNDVIRAAVESMSALNELASKIMVELGVKTATDVSGFGLLGHLNEICEASKVSAEIKYDDLPLLPGVNKLASDGIIPGGTKRNLSFATSFTYFHDKLTKIQQLISADAQTSGGLLISLPPDSAKMFIKKFNEHSPIKAQEIGNIIKQKTNTIYVT